MHISRFYENSLTVTNLICLQTHVFKRFVDLCALPPRCVHTVGVISFRRGPLGPASVYLAALTDAQPHLPSGGFATGLGY